MVGDNNLGKRIISAQNHMTPMLSLQVKPNSAKCFDAISP